MRGAGAPSPPSEEGGGCLHNGFEQADGGRDTVSMCESSRYSRQKKQMTAFSLRARLHLGANSDLAFSLPQSSPLYPKRLDSSLLRGSRGGSRRKSHRFNFAVKVRRKCYALSRIQPLSQALLILKGLTAPLAQGSREVRCITSVAHLYKNVTARRALLNFAACGGKI